MSKKKSNTPLKISLSDSDVQEYLRVLLRIQLLYGTHFMDWFTKNIDWIIKEYDKKYKK